MCALLTFKLTARNLLRATTCSITGNLVPLHPRSPYPPLPPVALLPLFLVAHPQARAQASVRVSTLTIAPAVHLFAALETARSAASLPRFQCQHLKRKTARMRRRIRAKRKGRTRILICLHRARRRRLAQGGIRQMALIRGDLRCQRVQACLAGLQQRYPCLHYQRRTMKMTMRFSRPHFTRVRTHPRSHRSLRLCRTTMNEYPKANLCQAHCSTRQISQLSCMPIQNSLRCARHLSA